MHIEYNGTLVATTATNVSGFLREREIDSGAVAVAVNGEFVPRAHHGDRTLQDGDRLEVVAPMQGG